MKVQVKKTYELTFAELAAMIAEKANVQVDARSQPAECFNEAKVVFPEGGRSMTVGRFSPAVMQFTVTEGEDLTRPAPRSREHARPNGTSKVVIDPDAYTSHNGNNGN